MGTYVFGDSGVFLHELDHTVCQLKKEPTREQITDEVKHFILQLKIYKQLHKKMTFCHIHNTNQMEWNLYNFNDYMKCFIMQVLLQLLPIDGPPT